MLIANSETPALGFAEALVLERELELDVELDEPVEEFELPPLSKFPVLSEPESNDWALADADVRIARTRTEQTLMAK